MQGVLMFSKNYPKKAKVTSCPLADTDAKMYLFLALRVDGVRKTGAAGPMSSQPSLPAMTALAVCQPIGSQSRLCRSHLAEAGLTRSQYRF